MIEQPIVVLLLIPSGVSVVLPLVATLVVEAGVLVVEAGVPVVTADPVDTAAVVDPGVPVDPTEVVAVVPVVPGAVDPTAVVTQVKPVSAGQVEEDPVQYSAALQDPLAALQINEEVLKAHPASQHNPPSQDSPGSTTPLPQYAH